MPPERLTVHPSGGYHPAMTPSLRALANAGVPVLEAAPLAPGGVAAPTLLAELYVFYGDSVTSRLPRVRSDDARAAWLKFRNSAVAAKARSAVRDGILRQSVAIC